MKILHIGEYVNGGLSTYLNEIISYQSSNHDVYLLMSRYNSKFNTEFYGKFDRDRISYYEYKRKPIYFYNAMKQIRKEIRRVDPDIIHLHSTFAGLLTRISLFFSRSHKFKLIYCAHGWSFIMDGPKYKKKLYALIERILMYKTDLIINISKFELKESLKYGLSKNKSVLIYSGLNEKKSKMKMHMELFDNEVINILFVGRYDRAKGLDVLVDLFNKNDFQHVKLYTVGGSVLGDQELHLPNNIVDLGWINNDLIDDYYSKCDVVIIPSRWEGFGLVAVEAMRNSKPVISSNRAALPEIVIDGVNGYVFDIENVEQLLKIINSLDRVELKKLGEQGKKIYMEKFTSDRMNQEIEATYKRLLEYDFV